MEDRAVTWTPSGDLLVFERHNTQFGPGNGPKGIHAIKPDGTDYRRLNDLGGQPVISPDGQWIACAEGSYPQQLAMMRIDGTGMGPVMDTSKVTMPAGYSYLVEPSWSSDGQRLFCRGGTVGLMQNRTDIFEVHLDASKRAIRIVQVTATTLPLVLEKPWFTR